MPRKSQYSKEEIAQYGLKIVETKGIESLTARELAKSLGTTVAPIFVPVSYTHLTLPTSLSV